MLKPNNSAAKIKKQKKQKSDIFKKATSKHFLYPFVIT